MGRKSTKENKSAYHLAREAAELSREKASMHLGISDKKLASMENGYAPLMPNDVLMMAKAYDAPSLISYYCAHTCPIGKMQPSKAEPQDNIYEILVRMAVSLEKANRDKNRMMEILEDGKVSPQEQKDFEKIKQQLAQISAMVESMQLWTQKMKID